MTTTTPHPVTLSDLIEHCQDGMPPQPFLMEHGVTLQQLREADAEQLDPCDLAPEEQEIEDAPFYPSIPPLTDQEVAAYVREEGF
tara:strand:+ start:225 stop:479 length:255 start_codon:yes stop_codon:yes gene_type:complete